MHNALDEEGNMRFRLSNDVVLMPTIPQFYPNFPHLHCGEIDAAPHPHSLPAKGGSQQSMK
jgi:hypothetical protein